jgi:hypothetical protein
MAAMTPESTQTVLVGVFFVVVDADNLPIAKHDPPPPVLFQQLGQRSVEAPHLHLYGARHRRHLWTLRMRPFTS